MLKITNIDVNISKYRTLPAHTKRDLHELIVKLNEMPEHKHNNIQRVNSDNKKEGQIIYDGNAIGKTTFRFNKSTFVTVNTLSGDVIKSHKSIFKSWEKIFQNMDNLLTNILKKKD